MTEKLNLLEVLDISEERFQEIFNKVNTVYNTSRNSGEFLCALLDIPNDVSESFLLGTAFAKLQEDTRTSLECKE